MATLGTLSAGVAHEMNNPAAAASRAAGQMADAIAGMRGSEMELARLEMADAEIGELERLATLARERAEASETLDAMAAADRETQLETWLDRKNVEDGWDLAPDLVQLGLDVADLDALSTRFQETHLGTALRWVCHAHRVERLRAEVAAGSARVAQIVGALKAYTYLGQAAEQEVDVNEGLENTLIILGSRLEGIDVEKHLAEGLPRIEATGSELNEVWTHLVDNAIWAMDGSGSLRIRTDRSADGGHRGGRRLGPRNPGREPAPGVRSLLHDQGSGCRYRLGTQHGARDRP